MNPHNKIASELITPPPYDSSHWSLRSRQGIRNLHPGYIGQLRIPDVLDGKDASINCLFIRYSERVNVH